MTDAATIEVAHEITAPAAPQRPTFALAPSATPADLLRMAVQQGADLDRLERLMALQTQWEDREAQKAYNVAFADFKAEAVRIMKNRQVTDGPLKNKKYAELFAVVNAATPALSKHGLSASWRLTKDDRDWIEVTCTLKHISGHSESVSMGGPPDAGGAKNAIQARASTVTYLERYTLKAITGLSEQEDDNDGGHGGGEGMSAGQLADFLAAIDAASTVGEMKTAYMQAAAAATAAKDAAASKKLAAARDAKLAHATKAG